MSRFAKRTISFVMSAVMVFSCMIACDSVYADDIKSPAIDISRLSPTEISLKWDAVEYASGYQIQYATDRLFCSQKTVNVDEAETTELVIGELLAAKEYYARIRAYEAIDDETRYSPWNVTQNVRKTRTVKLSLLKIGAKTFEIRSQAKLPLYKYDTLQGSCTDGTYAYYLMYNRKNEKCKLVKARVSDRRIIKVSAVLNVAHGNDITYDSKRKCLIAVHNTRNPKRISLINRTTLRVTRNVDVRIPYVIKGATRTQTKAIRGFAGIAYDAASNRYVVLLSKTHDFIVLNCEYKPVAYVAASKKPDYVYQGIDITGDYILLAQSPKTSRQPYNILSIYNMEGKYLSRINVKKSFEIESVYHIGSQFYAGFYRSYYKDAYKVKTKIVKKNGKKIKKKVRVKYKELIRSNYVYRLESF